MYDILSHLTMWNNLRIEENHNEICSLICLFLKTEWLQYKRFVHLHSSVTLDPNWMERFFSKFLFKLWIDWTRSSLATASHTSRVSFEYSCLGRFASLEIRREMICGVKYTSFRRFSNTDVLINFITNIHRCSSAMRSFIFNFTNFIKSVS